ncbi:hypothetical protein F8388_006051 [Cannabis sativa]|uniref:Uncharacterized protein n=1 Tax=Cannabis sativa TaxID=3483 RepID=A0A7J6H5N7_CANSA|nr:hypothetical protein F8388_006051 [Cannabis sativa]
MKLGPSVRGSGAVRAVNPRTAIPSSRAPWVCGVRQLPDQWCFHSHSFSSLLRSRLHLLSRCQTSSLHQLIKMIIKILEHWKPLTYHSLSLALPCVWINRLIALLEKAVDRMMVVIIKEDVDVVPWLLENK